jgi:DNA-directed RNA polymerase subunit RPC12/RpoP
MNEQITTSSPNFVCSECQNEVELPENKRRAGDVVECPYCGIEFELLNVSEGITTLQIIEEEK